MGRKPKPFVVAAEPVDVPQPAAEPVEEQAAAIPDEIRAIVENTETPPAPKRRGRPRKNPTGAASKISSLFVPDPKIPNPRAGSTEAAQMGRRREQIWGRRSGEGDPCRRKIYDDDGKDTGGTTSSLS
uniref:Uncharacterized protein n=1 Tax=viral metagenome TaxID=1070528 RepID=A0A6H1ZH57_9ZZZZ